LAKRPRKSATPEAIDMAVLALVRGATDSAIAAELVSAGTPRDDAGLVLTEARKRVQLTADYNRDEQLGLAICRLTKIVEANIDNKISEAQSVALRAQNELNKLLRLHEVRNGVTGEPQEDDSAERITDLSKVREHLAPLFNVPEDYPAPELARMAAERIRMADGGED